MGRLTYKEPNVVGGYEAVNTDEFACVEKLGQLEDIEEELDIDLTTLFKALRNGIYSRDGDIWYGTELHLSFKAKALFFKFDDGETIQHEEWFYFKDYGKTWALTREELESDKK